MANVGDKVFKKEWKDKIVSVKEFRFMHKGLSIQAITGAVNSGKLDYIKIGGRKLIVLTDRTLGYKPNKSVKRSVVGL